MATEINGIATEGEAKSKLKWGGDVDTNRGCTKARALYMGANEDKLSDYKSNQLVKYSDLYINYVNFTVMRALFSEAKIDQVYGDSVTYISGDFNVGDAGATYSCLPGSEVKIVIINSGFVTHSFKAELSGNITVKQYNWDSIPTQQSKLSTFIIWGTGIIRVVKS